MEHGRNGRPGHDLFVLNHLHGFFRVELPFKKDDLRANRQLRAHARVESTDMKQRRGNQCRRWRLAGWLLRRALELAGSNRGKENLGHLLDCARMRRDAALRPPGVAESARDVGRWNIIKLIETFTL